MGDIVAFSDDIEQMGRDFGTAASGVHEVLTQLQQATGHVRHAFHNHQDEAGPAVAPFTQLHATIEQVEEFASALALTLIDVGRSWYAKTLPDGRQVWVRVRNDVIRSAGVNAAPAAWSPATGLSRW